MTEVTHYLTGNEIAMLKDFMENGCNIDDINTEWAEELRSLLRSLGNIVTEPGFNEEYWRQQYETEKKKLMILWDEVIEQAKLYKGDVHGIDLKLRIKFCETLKYILKKFGLNQKEFAKGIGKTPVAVWRWIHGECCPTIKTMREIKEFLNNQTPQQEKIENFLDNLEGETQ